MTVHAMEEMAEDDLDIIDIEHAILNGEWYEGTRKIPEERSTPLRVSP